MPADLHVHSRKSDGTLTPADVVAAAARYQIDTLAIADHDSLDALPDARLAGAKHGVAIIAACEFSVRAPWGELHLLGYFLPDDSSELNDFLGTQRERRAARAAEIVRRLNASSVAVSIETVLDTADGAAVGRPHVARALIAIGQVADVREAFDRYLRPGRVGYVPKTLPELEQVTELIVRLGGVSSAAHLGDRASRSVARQLKKFGVDALEAVHPAHDATRRETISAMADELGMLKSGGSDWHGPGVREWEGKDSIGQFNISAEWVDRLRSLSTERSVA